MELATQLVLERDGKIRFPLTLASHITAWQQNGNLVQEGKSTVLYKFSARPGAVPRITCHDGGVLSRKTTDVGVQALPDDLRAEVRKHMNTSMQYDLRGLAFGLGALCARLHTSQSLPTRYAPYDFLSTGIMTMAESDLLITPPTERSSSILFVLGVCARMCGCQRVFTVSDRMLVGRPPTYVHDWAAALHASTRFLLSDAVSNGYGPEHLLAFGRGYSTGVSLNAHTEEGGWVRALFRDVCYPRPRGLINTNASSVTLYKIFSDDYHPEDDLVQSCLAVAVTMGAAVQDADPMSEKGSATVLERRVPARPDLPPGNPLHYPTLVDIGRSILDHCANVLGLTFLGQSKALHSESMRQTTGKFFSSMTNDRHLTLPSMLPYAYVEHGCVLAHPEFAKSAGPKAGTVRQLPLFPNGEFKLAENRNDAYIGGRARYVRAALKIKATCLREMGAYYVNSSRWTNDGPSALSKVALVSSSTMSGTLTDAVNMPRLGQPIPTLDSMAWVRPHCPVPLPGEVGFDEAGVIFTVDPNEEHSLLIEGGTSQLVSITCSPLICKFNSGGWDYDLEVNRQVSASHALRSGKRYNTRRQSQAEHAVSLFDPVLQAVAPELEAASEVAVLEPELPEAPQRPQLVDVTAPRHNNARLDAQSAPTTSLLSAEEVLPTVADDTGPSALDNSEGGDTFPDDEPAMTPISIAQIPDYPRGEGGGGHG